MRNTETTTTNYTPSKGDRVWIGQRDGVIERMSGAGRRRRYDVRVSGGELVRVKRSELADAPTVNEFDGLTLAQLEDRARRGVNVSPALRAEIDKRRATTTTTAAADSNNWIVRCRVSGGVTGTRQSILKNSEGGVQYFASEDDARAEARRLMNDKSPYSTAHFQYWAELADESAAPSK
jgi:hypothetical protein